jgi:hypothetical protein
MIFAKVGVDKTVTFGPVLAADGTMSSGAIAYTDAKIFKNGTDGALNASATFTHKYEGVYALLLKAADLDAVGAYEVVLNKNPLSAAPVKITVLAANVYDWLFGTVAPLTDKAGYSLSTAPPTAADIAALILASPAYKLVTDANGKVNYSNAAPDNTTIGAIHDLIKAAGAGDLAAMKGVVDKINSMLEQIPA